MEEKGGGEKKGQGKKKEERMKIKGRALEKESKRQGMWNLARIRQ